MRHPRLRSRLLPLLTCALAACSQQAKLDQDYPIESGEQRIAVRFEKMLLSMSLMPCDALIIRNDGHAPVSVNVNIWAVARVSAGDVVQELQVVVRNAPSSDAAAGPPILLDLGEGSLVVGQWATTQGNLRPADSTRDCLANFPDLERSDFKLKVRWLPDEIVRRAGNSS